MPQGNVQHDIVEGVCTVAEDFPRLIESVETMKETKLSRDEQTVFAEAGLVASYGEDESSVRSDQLSAPRRREDVGQSLWLTLNTAQQNLICGGLHGRRQITDGRIRRAQTRAINGIDQNVGLTMSPSMGSSDKLSAADVFKSGTWHEAAKLRAISL
jgi:Domain of unknown function (DUF932)